MKPSAMNKPDERLVYLAFRNVFAGEDAKIRTAKAIRKQIQKHANEEDVRALLQNHNADHVYLAAKDLLDGNVFESTVQAKIRFPEVFSVSPAQSAEREHSEEEAARSEANAIKNAAEGHLHSIEPQHPDPSAAIAAQESRSLGSRYCTETAIPSLYPIYLPFETQHRLMCRVQKILEDACFTFAQEHMKEELRNNGWHCTERVELNIWAQTFTSSHFPGAGSSTLGKPLPELLTEISNIRHTAVHRIEVSVTHVRQFLIDAEALATLLQDDYARDHIARQRGRLEVAIEEIKRNNELLSYQARETIRRLDEKIAEMRKLQQGAIESMLQDDQKFRRSVVDDLEIAIDPRASKQRELASREDRTPFTLDNTAESSSDVENECEKHDGMAEEST